MIADLTSPFVIFGIIRVKKKKRKKRGRAGRWGMTNQEDDLLNLPLYLTSERA